MARAALYNIYRPTKFEDVSEQDAIKQILSEQIKTNNLKRVMLFTGPAGTGKTTNARILAMELENTKANIIEINCADHTGVDDVRQLIIEPSKVKPLSGQYKIFILDENHMLTVQSQNALLKLLEEPPSHCIFILCTTDPQKVLGTILSRAFRYDFQLISHKGIVDRLVYILQEEQKLGPEGCGVTSWDMSALDLIATSAEGHLRNAVATLEKVISFSKDITVDGVVSVLGVTNYNTLFDILDCILQRNDCLLINKLNELNQSGMDLKLFTKNFLSFVLEINKYVILKTETNTTDNIQLTIPHSFDNKLFQYNQSHRPALKNLLRRLIELNSAVRWETDIKPVLETNLLLEVI